MSIWEITSHIPDLRQCCHSLMDRGVRRYYKLSLKHVLIVSLVLEWLDLVVLLGY